MATIIHTVKGREKLEFRREPYWQRLAAGQHIGYRVAASGPGSWIAKHRDELTGERKLHALGDFAHLPDAERFDAAANAAAAWFAHLAGGGSTERETVVDVCTNYVTHLRNEGKTSAADDAERRFAQYVLDNPKFAATEAGKLNHGMIASWRAALAKRPAPSGKPRTPSSLNRDMTPFRAALNHALVTKTVTTDAAWNVALRPLRNADKRRTAVPTRSEIDRIIAAAEPELAEFLKALAMVPIRPGAMAGLTVGNFNSGRNELTIPTDKTGENRTIKLPASTAGHFAKHCAGKLPGAPIFTRDGTAWTKDRWKLPVKLAAIAAGVGIVAKGATAIDPAQRMSKARETLKASTTGTQITIYSFRHAVITELVESGLSVQTIAQISGTSPRMIHQNYGHLTDRASVDALERLAR